MSDSALTRRQFIAGAGAAALTLPFIHAGRAFGADDRPNIVFILTDDQRHDAMSCAGHPFLHTPNLDRLAKEGTVFRNAFVTTSLCSPSRACILTGQYAHKHGVRDNRTNMSDDIPTFAQVLQQSGYDTALMGKWHMGGQEGPRPGFNRWVSFRGLGVYRDPLLNIDGERKQENGYLTDILTRYAVDWLRKPRTSPFCLYLSHKAVHGPFQPPLRHSKLFADAKIPRPVSIDDDLKGKPKWQEKRVETRGGDAFESRVRSYCRTVMGIDDSVRQVLRTLEDMGQLDNTIVLFCGDNGFFLGEHGMFDKRAMYEESIRIPMLMRYPKLTRPGTSINDMVLNIDFCPTFLDLAGARIPEGVQGKSIKPLLRGNRRGWRTDFLYEYFWEPGFITPTMRGVRGQRWKYCEYPEIEDIAELYDLDKDPLEMHNLAADTAHKDVLALSKTRVEQLLKATA